LADTYVSSSRADVHDARAEARTIVVAQELCSELDRWSAYAQAAEADAMSAAQHAAEAVTLAVREAAFVDDLAQRNRADLASVVSLVEEAEAAATATAERLAKRRDSWQYSQDIAKQSVTSWAAALHDRQGDVTSANNRLQRARQSEERLAASSAPSRFTRGRRSAHGRDEHDLAQARANVRRLTEEVATAERAAARCESALGLAERALALADEAVAELREGLQSAAMALDYAAGARATCREIERLLQRQAQSAEKMLFESRAATRELERSGRVLGAVCDAYDDSQQHLFDARRDMADRIETLREQFGRAVSGTLR
jgi:chromosome segregation ATPase